MFEIVIYSIAKLDQLQDEYLGDVLVDFVDRLGNVRWQKQR